MIASHLIEHIEKIGHFISIADAGSFAKAAKNLRLTQPTLSHTVKVLENLLETELFYRSSNGVELTPAGGTLYEYGKKLVQDTLEMEQSIRLRTDTLIQRITIGTKEPYAIRFWPEYLKVLGTKFPNAEFSLFIKRTNKEILEALVNGKIEFALVPNPSLQEDIISFEIFTDSLCFFANKPNYPNKTFYTFSDGICSKGHTIGNVLAKNGVPLELINDVDSFNVAKSMAIEGLGMGLFSKTFASKDVEKGRLFEVKDPPIESDAFGPLSVCLCMNRRNEKNKTLKAVLKTLKALHRS